MCSTDFFYILVGDDQKRMVLCRREDFKEGTVRKIVREIFPELFGNFWRKIGIDRIKTEVTECYKERPSWFDGQIRRLEKENDWRKFPFAVLWIFNNDGKEFCGAEKICKAHL